MQRAVELCPLLVERQAETEVLGRYSEDTHQKFRDAGFYGMLVPRRYGGHEVSLSTYFRVVREIARGCPSTGWMFSLSHSHAVTAATHWDELAQAEFFADAEYLAPATHMVQGTAERLDSGGWRISGTWNYCSGAPYSTHAQLHANIAAPDSDGAPPTPLIFIAPRSAYEVLDDWGDVLGLKGTGSNSIRMDNAEIPEHYALPGVLLPTLDPTTAVGRRVHSNPLYTGSQVALYLLDGANLALGFVKGAFDEWEQLLLTKNVSLPPFGPRSEDIDYHLWYGNVLKQLATAELALDGLIEAWMATARRGTWTQKEELWLNNTSFEMYYGPCWKAMQTIFRTAGAHQIRDGQRMARVWRDYSQFYAHGGHYAYNQLARALTAARIGVASRTEGTPEFFARKEEASATG